MSTVSTKGTIVKIVKCSSNSLWYSKYIGEEIEVEKESIRNARNSCHLLTVDQFKRIMAVHPGLKQRDLVGLTVVKEDCVIIKQGER